MAWGSIALDSDYIDWMEADKPLILGENRLSEAISYKWLASLDLSGTSYTDKSITRLWDGFTDLQTYSTAAGYRWLGLGFASPGIEFDTIAFINHNLEEIATTSVGVRIADDAAFTLNVEVIASWAPTVRTGTRTLFPELYHTGSSALRYTNVQYINISYNLGSDIGKIGELFVGNRRQMKTNPFDPWDPAQLQNHEAVTQAVSGVRTKYVYSRGQRVIRARYGPHEDDRIDDLIELYRDDTEHGSLPFVWCDAPSTSPDEFNMMHFDAATRASPYRGPQQREFMLSATEQGPDFLELEL